MLAPRTAEHLSFDLSSICDTYPAPVDERITTLLEAACPTHIHIAFCQFIYGLRCGGTRALLRALKPTAPSHRIHCSRMARSGQPDATLELNANMPGMTALMLAAMVGHTRAVRSLLQRGASPALVNAYGRTPLMLAAMSGHEEVRCAPCHANTSHGAVYALLRAVAPPTVHGDERVRTGGFVAAVCGSRS